MPTKANTDALYAKAQKLISNVMSLKPTADTGPQTQQGMPVEMQGGDTVSNLPGVSDFNP